MFVNEFSLYIARKVLDILKKVRPTGIELVSPAPQAGALSIELWALPNLYIFYYITRNFSYSFLKL